MDTITLLNNLQIIFFENAISHNIVEAYYDLAMNYITFQELYLIINAETVRRRAKISRVFATHRLCAKIAKDPTRLFPDAAR